MLVVTSSAIAELHGREIANKLVLIGFIRFSCRWRSAFSFWPCRRRRRWLPIGWLRSKR